MQSTEAEAAANGAAATVSCVNGFPDVPRFSSCWEYLELCEEDVFINSAQLDTKLVKIIGGNGKWRHESNGSDLTAREIIELLREAVAARDQSRGGPRDPGADRQAAHQEGGCS